jgi:hypothetical protein
MLKIGLTQLTTIPTARETGATDLTISNTTIIKKSEYGQPNFTNVGLNKKVIKLVYTDVEITEYEQHKQYCSPYVTQSFWCNLTNENEIKLIDAPCFLSMEAEVFNHNMTKISYLITLYEL